jgi:hypothetical protein
VGFQLSWYHGANEASPYRGYRQIAVSDSVSVGRQDGSDIVLKDEAVSRLHAEISVDDRGVHVRDMNSANGIRLDGNRVREALWTPGQKLAVGPFVLELVSQVSQEAPEIVVPNRNPTIVRSRLNEQSQSWRNDYSRAADPALGGRIALGEVFERAKQNHKASVTQLFSGFLGSTEQVIDCGYLGAIGFIFPEHSFWCVTNSRACGLLVNRGGWLNFDFGFLKALDRAVFVQPSLIKLWLWVIFWVVLTFMVSSSLFGGTWWSVYFSTYSGLLAWIAALIVFALSFAGGIMLVPWVVRAYYRWFKAGCIFWTKEHAPIVVPSDRYSLRDAQRFISVFTDQKRMLEG